MPFLYLFFVGILIGTAMVIPGLSGGVLAVILGVYDKMIYSLNNLFKDFKKSFIYLFILSLGVMLGAVWFSNVIFLLYEKYQAITKLVFIGLILGGIPCLLGNINKKEKNNYLIILITFLISFILCYFAKNFTNIFNNNYSSLSLFITGILYSVGKVIPGISSSFLIMIIGKYEFVLKIIAHPISFGLANITKILPFFFGLIIGVIIFLKIISFLFNNYYSKTYAAIIGLVLGTIPGLIPNNIFNLNIFISIILFAFSFLLSYKLTVK